MESFDSAGREAWPRAKGIMEGLGAWSTGFRRVCRLVPARGNAVAVVRVVDGDAVADFGKRVAGESNLRVDFAGDPLGPARGVAADMGRVGRAGELTSGSETRATPLAVAMVARRLASMSFDDCGIASTTAAKLVEPPCIWRRLQSVPLCSLTHAMTLKAAFLVPLSAMHLATVS